MRVFMLGWEFPPFISGGLGTACYGLTKAMSSIGTDIMFVLPRPVATPFSTHLRLVSPRAGSPLAAPTTEFRLDEFEHVTFRTLESGLGDPYLTPEDYEKKRAGYPTPSGAETASERLLRATKIAEGTLGDADATNPAGAMPASGATPGFIGSPSPGAHYAGDLFGEIQRYAQLAAEVARG